MKILITQEFDAPLEIVVRAKDERFQNLDKIPNLKPQKIIKQTEKRNLIKTKREFEAGKYGVPPMVKGFISPDMFKFTEVSIWDKKTNILTWEITPAKFQDKFEWKGETYYEEKTTKGGKKKTVRTIEGVIKIKIPFVGDVLEKTIGAGFRKSIEKDYDTINQMVKIMVKWKNRNNA